MSLVEIGTLTLCEIVGDFGYQQFANNGGLLFNPNSSGFQYFTCKWCMGWCKCNYRITCSNVFFKRIF